MARPKSNEELLEIISGASKIKGAGVGHSWYACTEQGSTQGASATLASSEIQDDRAAVKELTATELI